MRRPYSGHSDAALVLPATTTNELMTGSNFDGKHVIFWLRNITIRNFNAGNATVIDIYDQDEAVAVAANQRLSLDVPAATTAMFDFPAPGIAFYTNLTAASTPIGTIAAYEASASGYEEGGM